MNFIQLYFAEGNVKCSNKNVTFLCRGCLMPSLVSNSKEVIEDRCRPSLTVLRTSLLNKLNIHIVPLGLNFIYRGTFFTVLRTQTLKGLQNLTILMLKSVFLKMLKKIFRNNLLVLFYPNLMPNMQLKNTLFPPYDFLLT